MTIRFHEELVPYLVPIDSVKQHPRNVNSGDIEAIADSILANGFYNPVIVQRSSGHIIAGNHRYAALLSLGATDVPAVSVDVDDERALRMMLADNRTSELSRRDEHGLERLLSELSEGIDGLVGTGYEDDDLADLIRANQATDHIPLGKYDEAEEPGERFVRRVVIYGYLEDNGVVRGFDEGDAEEAVVRLRDLGYNAQGGFG